MGAKDISYLDLPHGFNPFDTNSGKRVQKQTDLQICDIILLKCVLGENRDLGKKSIQFTKLTALNGSGISRAQHLGWQLYRKQMLPK